MSASGECAGKVVLVAGGAGLVGRGVARGLARAGARLVIGSRDGKRAAAIAQALGAPDAGSSIDGGSIEGVALDVRSADSVGRVVADVVERCSGLDGLVACQHVEPCVDHERLTLAEWNEVLETSLTGSFLLTRAAIDAMRQDGHGGSVVLVGSIFASRGPDPRVHRRGSDPPSHGAYWTAKAGMVGLARYLAAYHGSDGIRVNVLSPGGVVDSDRPLKDEFLAAFAERVPLGRLAVPDELGPAAAFLIGDGSRYVTGQEIVVDGGYTAI